MRRSSVFLPSLVFLISCTDFAADHDPDGTCGNRILEPEFGEDCDTFAGFEGGTCLPPSDANRCRFGCASKADCPSGWECGLDGVCRAPSAQFFPLAPVSYALPDPEQVRFGDVNGDGQLDLVKLLGPTIETRLGTPSGTYGDPVSFVVDVPSGPFDLADLDSDGRDDLIVPQLVGVTTASGQPDGTFEPVIHPIAEMLRPDDFELVTLPGVSRDPATDLQAYVAFHDGQTQVTVADDFRTYNGRPWKPIFAADVDGDGAAELALGLQGTRNVFVLSVTCDDPGVELLLCRFTRSATVTFDGQLAGAPRLADLNGDGLEDVIAPVEEASERLMHVSYATAPGVFGPAAPYVHSFSLFDVSIGGVFNAWPLAEGDLDGDGDLDFITRTFIAMGQNGAEPIQTVGTVFEWSEAVIGDFNDDGISDGAMASRFGASVTFAMGNEEGLPLLVRVATDGNVSNLVVGDFDGNAVDDVAYVEGGRQVAVLFSDRSGAPRDRVVMGEIPNTLEMEAGRIANVDVIDDLVVFSEADNDMLQATLLTGAAEGPMAAPLRLEGDSFPIIAIAGEFDDDRTLDLAVIGIQFDEEFRGFGLELRPGLGDGRFGVAPAAVAFDTAGAATVQEVSCSLVEHADLLGDSAPEMILAPDQSECFDVGGPPEPRDIRVVSLESDGSVSSVELDAKSRLTRLVDPVDLGDERRALLVQYRSPDQAVLYLPAEGPAPIAEVSARAATVLHGRLAYLAEDRIFVAPLEDVSVLENEVNAPFEFDALRGRMEAADANGDGLVDILLMTGSELIVYVQRPCRADDPTCAR